MITKPSGMTLIEVLTALAVFSVLSLLGVKALESITRTAGHLDLRHQQLHEITVLLRLLEQDFLENDQGRISWTTQANTNVRQWQLHGAGVTYSLSDDGRISRLDGMPGDETGPATTFVTQARRIDIQIAQASSWRQPDQLDSRFRVQAIKIDLQLETKGLLTKTFLLPGGGL